jgi:hypothetical protein
MSMVKLLKKLKKLEEEGEKTQVVVAIKVQRAPYYHTTHVTSGN